MPELPHTIAIDLELDRAEGLAMVGAARAAGDDHFLRTPRTASATTTALRELDAFVGEAPLWCGHNVLWHDRPWLLAHAPELRLLQLPVVDTLVLSTLAFAEHPYHALCKTHKPTRSAANDPVEDSWRSLELLDDAVQRLRGLAAANPTLARLLVALAIAGMHEVDAAAGRGMALCLTAVSPPSADLPGDLRTFLAGRVCAPALDRVLAELVSAAAPTTHLELLFAVTWLRVAGDSTKPSQSVLMPWVRNAFPGVPRLLHRLRDVACERTDCSWCRTMHDPRGHLQRWFAYDDFRREPALADGTSAQAAIVAAGFAERPLLALLPTGGGKSLCFQLPAIARYLRRGSLTIVVSPLQSLMHDQVDNFHKKTSLSLARALTGRLSAPERSEALEAVRSGSAGLLYVSPEQLRNPSFAAAIEQREIGAFVFDEAHCLSKWGHDFRPDYLYAARFVREHAERTHTAIPPVVCVTATAKPEVRDELIEHFRSEIGQELAVFDGHAPRQNLQLAVEDVRRHDKVTRMVDLVAEQLALDPTGSVLVYTSTRVDAERTAARLGAAGIPADAFHARLPIPTKKDVQARFLGGDCRVVCATNAFGMGIDKPDIRLVVHFAIPGSLEAYVQEVGRAGRDGKPSRAVLLHDPSDVEQQFRMAAQSRLDVRDLQAILRRVRGLAQLPRRPATGYEPAEPEVVCTTGEILRDADVAQHFEAGERDAPTKVVTAIAWLERGRFVRRDHNQTNVFQGRPRVRSLTEARARMAGLQLPPARVAAWLAVLGQLLASGPDEGIGTDALLDLQAVAAVVPAGSGPRAGRALLAMLFEMQQHGLLTRGLQMTAFVRHGIADASRDRLAAVVRLELQLLALLRELEPDPDRDQHYPLHLPSLTQRLAEEQPNLTADRVRTLLAATADRAQHAGPNAPGLRVMLHSRDQGSVQVRGEWDGIVATAVRRQAMATICLDRMLAPLAASGAQGKGLLVEFTLEDLQAAIDQDLLLRSAPSPNPVQELEHVLLFLHRTEVLVLHKGLAVFRQAMTIRLPGEKRTSRYTQEDFAPMAEHQHERTRQVHVMAEFAARLQRSPTDGLAFLDDYFRLSNREFLDRHFRRRIGELDRATGSASWQAIVGDLTDDQRRIVTAAEDRSMLVLAGPGSGKTRVVVHRCAWLLRVKRVPAASILVLCFNRSAALELRVRLRNLVGDDANGVLVQTYHGMAARLVGRSPASELDAGSGESVFDALLDLAIAQIEPAAPASGASRDGADTGDDDLRERLLLGFRHILVDEYQDIDEKQYRLVSAIAGRTLQDRDRKLTVLAVGDDDQNVYQFRGSNVAFLRRFEQDYEAQRVPLVENHRSTAHIVAVANQVIAANPDRLKVDTPVRVAGRRADEPPGGAFSTRDPLAAGRVHLLQVASLDATGEAVRQELQRLRSCEPRLQWQDCAVLSPRHGLLERVRGALELAGIPSRVRIDDAHSYSLFRLREVQEFLAAVDAHPRNLMDAKAAQSLLAQLRAARPRERTFDLVANTLAAFFAEHGEGPWPKTSIEPFFGELLLEQRRERTLGDGVLLGTVHGSKGTEYEHVLLLDGDWRPRDGGDWPERRRVYYVGMTRAKSTLTLLQVPGGAPWLPALQGPAVVRTTSPAEPAREARTTRRQLLGQTDLYLGFAGQSAEHRAIAEHIADLACGDPLAFGGEGERMTIVDAHGRCVGKLSSNGSTHWGPLREQIVAMRCAAVVVRHSTDESPEYRNRARRSAWHVVVPEVEFTTAP